MPLKEQVDIRQCLFRQSLTLEPGQEVGFSKFEPSTSQFSDNAIFCAKKMHCTYSYTSTGNNSKKTPLEPVEVFIIDGKYQTLASRKLGAWGGPLLDLEKPVVLEGPGFFSVSNPNHSNGCQLIITVFVEGCLFEPKFPGKLDYDFINSYRESPAKTLFQSKSCKSDPVLAGKQKDWTSYLKRQRDRRKKAIGRVPSNSKPSNPSKGSWLLGLIPFMTTWSFVCPPSVIELALCLLVI